MISSLVYHCVVNMEIVVRISLLAATLAYLACDHYIDCKLKMIPDRKRDMNKDSINTKREVSDLERAPVCGRVLAVKEELRRALNESFGDYIQDDSQLNMNTQNDSHLEKILGGSYAVYGEFPWMAHLKYNQEHYCGGVIVSEYWVITAAHCVTDGWRGRYTVSVGDFDNSRTDKYEASHYLNMIYEHELYTDAGFDYDIALLQISETDGRGIIFNSYVQPICLPYATEYPRVGLMLTVIGWGFTKPYGGSPDILKKTALPVVDYATCLKTHPRAVTPNFFCAGYFNGDTNECAGDSGGPALAKSIVGMMVYGIVSFGSANCMAANPPAFSSIARFRDWIDYTIQRHSQGKEGLMPARKTIIM